jgi:hypothetical protein
VRQRKAWGEINPSYPATQRKDDMNNIYSDQTSLPAPPLATEQSLAELEAVIERGLKSFVEVGTALWKIRDQHRYREQGHATFEEYCDKRWKMSRFYAHRVIDASEVAANLLPMGNIPQTERQARELLRLTPEYQLIVAGRIDFTTATAVEIRREVEREIREHPEAKRKSQQPKTVLAAVNGKDKSKASLRELRVGQFYKLMVALAALPQPVACTEIKKRVRQIDSQPNKSSGFYSLFMHCAAHVPWVRMERNQRVSYTITINAELKRICDGEQELKAWSGNGILQFLTDLRRTITEKRKAAHAERYRRQWNLDKVVKRELEDLVEWIETELDRLPHKVTHHTPGPKSGGRNQERENG